MFWDQMTSTRAKTSGYRRWRDRFGTGLLRILPVIVLASLVMPPPARAGAGDTFLVSYSSTGNAPGGASEPAVSENGRFVAWESESGFYVENDTNMTTDVFLRDQELGTTVRVSATTTGVQGNGQSRAPSISADGRFVAFTSYASNLVPNDTNRNDKNYVQGADVFVWDRTDGSITRVSVGTTGTQANEDSYDAVISPDGRYVAYTSEATNLVPNDTNESHDAYLYDRKDKKVELISVARDGNSEAGYYADSVPTDMSEHGRYVAFWSSARTLVDGDTNNVADVFVRDRVAGTTMRISVSSSGSKVTVSASSPPYLGTVALWRSTPRRGTSLRATPTPDVPARTSSSTMA